jgi:hypothetical protein
LEEEELEKYPHLKKELENDKTKKINLEFVTAEQAEEIEAELKEKAEQTTIQRQERDIFDGYNPTVVDFIRRCDTEEEALEIIEYMEKTEQITSKEADDLRKQLNNSGIRSFGEKKEKGYYLNHLGEQ